LAQIDIQESAPIAAMTGWTATTMKNQSSPSWIQRVWAICGNVQ
jgi:hypothetical protein